MPDDRTADAARLGAPDVRAAVLSPAVLRSGLIPSRGADGAYPEDAWSPVASEPMWSLMNTRAPLPLGLAHGDPRAPGEPSPADRPYAELWMGAHPDAPSVLSERHPARQGDRGAARRPARAGRPRAVRDPAAVPDEGARRRPAALAAGAPDDRAGPRRFRRRGGRRRAARRPDAHVQGSLPQAGTAARADHRSRPSAASGRSRSRCTAWRSSRCPSSSRPSPRSPVAACGPPSRS